MTKTEYRKKCRDLKKEVARLIDNRTEKLLKSGAFDLKAAENNYILPKAVFCSIGGEIRFRFKPLNEDGKKLVKTIDCHI